MFFVPIILKVAISLLRHLIKNGHKNIACITTTESWEEFKSRTEGYKAALDNYSIDFNENIFLYGDRSYQSGYAVIMSQKDKLGNFSGIFAQTDFMALGAIEALKELKIRVPEDIAVVGYDDNELVDFFKPRLTTIHQPREKISVLACEALINLIKRKKVEKKCVLIVPLISYKRILRLVAKKMVNFI